MRHWSFDLRHCTRKRLLTVVYRGLHLFLNDAALLLSVSKINLRHSISADEEARYSFQHYKHPLPFYLLWFGFGSLLLVNL